MSTTQYLIAVEEADRPYLQESAAHYRSIERVTTDPRERETARRKAVRNEHLIAELDRNKK